MPRSLSENDIATFRERLCATATKLFLEKGVEGVTMREIALALGVSAMTPYRYFRDKNEILAAVRARAFDQFVTALEQAYDGTGTVLERALAKRDAYIRFALENKDSYRLMYDLAQPDTKDFPELDQALRRARATMVSHATDMVAAGVMAGDPVRIAHLLWVIMHGLVSLELAGKLGPELGAADILEEASAVIDRAYSPTSPPPA